VVGGGIAMFVDYTPEAIVDRLTGGVAGHPSLLQVTYVGPIEELIKGIAVVLIGRRVARKSMRNGLLVGGAVGFGFSGFENLGYGLRSWLGAYGAPGIPGLISNTVLRELTGPVGHPLWTALLGAAIFAAWGQRRVGPRLAVLGTYLGVSFLHSAWDSADRWLALLANDPSLTGGYNVEAWIFVAVVGIVAWRIVSLRAKRSNLGFIAREPLEQPLIDGTR
jgi:RsiW-degrading membrane proteinase PrsW (M82 family)